MRVESSRSCIFRVQVQSITKLTWAQKDTSSNDFLNLNYTVSPLHVSLMNDFDKTFIFASSSSFLKIKLNRDKKRMLISNTHRFQKKILFNVTCVLIYWLCSENFIKLTEIYPWRSLLLRKLQYLKTVKEVTAFIIVTFWKKCFTNYNFLGIYKIFKLTNTTNLDCQMWFQ